MSLEGPFQTEVRHSIEQLLPGSWVLKLDSSYLQGIPDLLVIWRDRWAILEVKRREPRGPRDFEPNQPWYLDTFNEMSFAACIYPENKEEVLRGLHQAFTARRPSRVSQRKQVPLGQLRQ
jgi:hypothetical protein